MNRKYYLIIQGPILSIGRTGKTNWEASITESSIVKYNCIENLKNIISDFGHLFEEIVIATWSNESIDNADIPVSKKVKLVKMDDPTPAITRGKSNLATSINNKYRQFYSSLKALDYFETAEPDDYVIKFRTDQYLDLNELISFHKSEGSVKYPERIFVPFIGVERFHLSDFYFIGRFSDLKNLFSSVIAGNYVEFHPSVHAEISLKYAYYYFRNEINVPSYTYFINTFYKRRSRESVRISNYLSSHVYMGIPLEITKNLIWRGEKTLWPKNYLESAATYKNWDVLIDNTRNRRRIRPWNFFIHANAALYLHAIWKLRKTSWLYKFLKKRYTR